jgi:hypothetical protein
VSIHTVTAFLYCGLPGRHFWLTAILAPRFLASAFAAGPALLILLCLFIRKVPISIRAGKQIQTLAKTVAYAICINVFFFCVKSSWPFTATSRATWTTSNTCSWACTATAPGALDVELHDPDGHRHHPHRHPGDPQKRDLSGGGLCVIIMGTWIDKGWA